MSLIAEDAELWDAVFPGARGRFIERMIGQPGAEILDVGCATGTVCAHLRRRGFRTVGLDVNHRFIGAARAKDPGGRYVVGDMRALSLRRKFDVVLCLGTTLAYNLTNDDVLMTLRGVHRHLVVGGTLIIDVLNAIAFGGPRPFQRHTVHKLTVRGESLTATIEHRLRLREQLMTEQVTWRGRRRGRAWARRDAAESLRLFFPQELVLFLEVCGFSSIELADRYTGKSQSFEGRRLIARARKEGGAVSASDGASRRARDHR